MDKIFVFAGQGSQFYGMGSRLYQDNQFFRKHLDIVDNKIIDIYGKSIKHTMMDERKRSERTFDDITESSFSIFAFEYSAAMMMIESGVEPDAVIGCSLGEVAAQVIAKALSLDEALVLIYKQSKLFINNRGQCCMIALGGNYKKDIDIEKYPNCEIISVSHERQFVVSGESDDIKRLEQDLKEKKFPFIKLPVTFPFHTANIEKTEDKYLQLLKELNYGERKLNCKMYSCVTTKPVVTIDDHYRWGVLREKIRWRECIDQIDEKNTIFIDLSSDGELAISLKYLLSSDENVYKVSTMFNSKIDMTDVIRKIKEKGDGHLKAFVFPGQGSQIKGMGADLFDEFPDLVSIADKVLGYSIKDLCINDPKGVLNNTRYTQPALFTVCALGYLKKLKDGESKPDFVAGHSIGEYAALFAAGIIDFETGIKLVKKRAELMSLANGGAMAAVVGLKKEQVEEILRKNQLSEIDIANLNTPSQIVISGVKEDIVKAEKYFTDTEGCFMYKVLNVSGAFHSRYMQPAKDEFTEYLKQFKYHKMEIPVIANINARPYKEGKVVETLSKQLVSSVYWTDSVRYMMAKGVDSFEEIGPGHVAIGMVRKIQREATPLELDEEIEDSIEENIDSPKQEIVQRGNIKINGNQLGSKGFIKDYNLKYTYIIGSMCSGISGAKMLKAAADAGLLAIAGTEKMTYKQIEELIKEVQQSTDKKASTGFNLCYDILRSKREKEISELYLKYGVTIIEATGYSTITKPLVKYRLTGLKKNMQGEVVAKNHIIAKVSRSEIAECFMSPAPKRIVDVLLRDGEITEEEAALSQLLPMSYDICVEADCGGYTDCANLFSVLPAIKSLSEQVMKKYSYNKKIRVGASGGIGTAQSAASAYLMGADFIMTGSINQCTVESQTSDMAKEMMSVINVQDTGYINAWEEYDSDKKIQVLKRGTLFKARADKLYSIYQNTDGVDFIDEKTKTQIETRYFKKTFEDVFEEIKQDNNLQNEQILEAETKPKMKLKLILKWYYEKSLQWAIQGDMERQSDFQIMCGAALGSFNQWVKGTELEDWRNRTVASVADKIMNSAAEYLQSYFDTFIVE